MRHVLLLTATISPRSGAKSLSRSDRCERLQDYLRAFRFYLGALQRGTFDQIVFVENSASDLAEFHRLAKDAGLDERVSLTSVSAEAEPNLSRFYLELELLSKAVAALPPSLRAGDVALWKVTGRYVIANIDYVVRTSPRDFNIYVQSHSNSKGWTDFYLAAFTAWAFEQLFIYYDDCYRDIDNGEEMLFRQLSDRKAEIGKVFMRMRAIPRLSGIRGYDGRDYDDARGRAGFYARVALRRVAPWIWL